MIIPVRCFSCGKVIGGIYEEYQRLLAEGKTPREALDKLGVTRYCCRRMLLTHVDLLDLIMPYS